MIRVNDKYEVPWREGMTVRDILKACKFTFPLVIVSINGEIVPRTEYDTRRIPDNAEVKVMHLISGG